MDSEVVSRTADSPYAREAEVLRLLADLGAQRAEDERHGGALWAEFCDWCWALDAPCTAGSAKVFAADRMPSLSAGQWQRLLALVTGPAS